MQSLPERPLLLYPSLAKTLGVEAAILLSFYAEQASVLGNPISLPLSNLLRQLSFWSETQILGLSEQLVVAGVIEAKRSASMIEIRLLQADIKRSAAETVAAESAPVSALETQRLPVVDYTNRRPTPAESRVPNFGGSSGWRKEPSELDEIFAAAEQRKKQLREMHLDWRPSQMFFELLSRNPMTPEFAENCLDEFIAYYIEKGKAENNWDQRFLAWVKRAWRDEESQQARANKFNEASQVGGNHETSRRDSRENRKRVTAAIMDLKNLDW